VSAAPGDPPPRRPSLARGGRALTLAEIVGFVAPLAVLPYVTRTLGVESYGRLQFVMALGAFASLVADPGLGRVATRRAARRPERAAAVFARIQPLRFATGVASAAALVAGAFLSGAGTEVRLLLAVQGALIVVQSLSADPYLLALGVSPWVGYLRAASVVAYAAGVLLFVRSPADAWRVLAVNLAVAAALVASARWRLRRAVGPLAWRPRARASRIVLREASGFALASVMSTVYSRVDVLMLRAFRGEAAVGVYSACVRITEGVFGVMPVILGTLYPRAITEGRRSPRRLAGHGQRALRLVALFGVPAAAGAVAAGGPIVGWFAGPGFGGTDAITAILGLASLAGLVAAVVSSFGLGALGRSRDVFAATVVGAAVNAGLNLVAIPWFGAEGAAATTLLAQVAVAVVCARRARDAVRMAPARALLPWAAPSLAMVACVLLGRLAGASGGLLLAIGLAAYPLAVVAFSALRTRERRGLRRLLALRQRPEPAPSA
jgi:PST family polysaccharide transporter